MLDFPTLRDALWHKLDAGALGDRAELRRENVELERSIDVHASVHEGLRDEVWRGEGWRERRTVDRVRHANVVRDVREDRPGVRPRRRK